ncbi:MAG: DUF192 domain-containing protein [Candidatus Nanoarchaeia archaeon]
MIVNHTRDKVIATDYTLCKSIFSKALGLMFSRPKTLVFRFSQEKIIPLHMFFVFFPIDVIYLDKNMKVVEVVENFKPFSYYRPKKPAQYVVEIPAGSANGTRAGDKLSLPKYL